MKRKAAINWWNNLSTEEKKNVLLPTSFSKKPEDANEIVIQFLYMINNKELVLTEG